MSGDIYEDEEERGWDDMRDSERIDLLLEELNALKAEFKKILPSYTYDGRIVVNASEWERLKRLEDAVIHYGFTPAGSREEESAWREVERVMEQ